MGRENLENPDANRGHEPAGIPLNRPSAFAKPTADEPGTFSPAGGEGRDEGARSMGRENRIKVVYVYKDFDVFNGLI